MIPPDDNTPQPPVVDPAHFLLANLSHQNKGLKETVAMLSIAHGQLDAAYCRSEEQKSFLQDTVDDIPHTTAAFALEAGSLRDEKTRWETIARERERAAKWGFGFAIAEGIVIAVGIVAAIAYYWYLHH